MRQVLLIGRSGADPDLKRTQQGTSILKLPIAVTEKRSDAQETHWFDVVVFGKSAEIAAEQVRKGYEVFVLGNLSSRNYKDAQGKMQRNIEILVNRIRVTSVPRGQEAENLDDIPI